jgi:hypothetical protein
MPGGYCIEDHPAIDTGWYFWTGGMFDRAEKPTHWMQLPAAPQNARPSPSTGEIAELEQIGLDVARRVLLENAASTEQNDDPCGRCGHQHIGPYCADGRKSCSDRPFTGPPPWADVRERLRTPASTEEATNG